MKVIDITSRFMDNAIAEKEHRNAVWHWTGGGTAQGAIDWLDKRLEGKGSVGYNYIIGRDGNVYMLADPRTHYMHNTGSHSTIPSKGTVSISFACRNAEHGITEAQIAAARDLVKQLNDWFVLKHYHHAQVNSTKIDFPSDMWESLKKQIGI
jgi:hypothetical protein